MEHFITVLNINGNLVQIANAQPAATQQVAQTSSPTTSTVVQQAPAGLAVANGNLVMVRSPNDVRNDLCKLCVSLMFDSISDGTQQ